MAALTIYPVDLTGDSKAYVAGASGGDTFANDGRTIIHAKNTSGGGITVTVDSVQPCNFGVDHNVAVVVAATTGDEVIGPFNVARFGSTASITYSANPPTGLTLAALQVPIA